MRGESTCRQYRGCAHGRTASGRYAGHDECTPDGRRLVPGSLERRPVALVERIAVDERRRADAVAAAGERDDDGLAAPGEHWWCDRGAGDRGRVAPVALHHRPARV